jgi:hypothetical protein
MHANGATAGTSPGEDAAAGLVALYGLWAEAPEDVGVAHWRWIGNGGGYSKHARTRIFGSDGIELPKACAPCKEPIYRVQAGQSVQFELSYENQGKSPQTIKIGYYLSTDDLITTADSRLGSRTQTFSRNTVVTSRKTLTIPSTLTRGRTYWLGAIADYPNVLRERYEDNNAASTGIVVE